MTLILQGTDNSVSTPAVQGGTAGTTTGVYYPATNVVALATNGAEALRINASGFLGVGTSSPAFPLTVVSNGAYTASAGFFSPNASYFNLALACGYGNVNMYISSAGTTDESLRFINSGGSEVLRIQKTGGITFNNSSALTNSTLNDYETGTWSPSVGGTSSCAGYGTYVKIGKIVCVNFDLIINTIGTGSTAKITNFPFACGNNGGPSTGSISYYSGLTVSPIFIAFYIENNAITAPFVWNTGGSSTIGFNATALFQSTSRVIGTVTYSASF